MNMRKIIAVLSAVLLLCAAIPMGALSVVAAPGDVIVDWNFDDGVAHFERGTVEDGYLVFDASTGDWQNCYAYVDGFQANVDYVVTFKAKANTAANMSFKINNNWAGDTAEAPVSVTTEWQDFELVVNSGELTSTAVLMFYAPYPASGAPTFYIDNLKIVEYEEPLEPGVIANGDFENGSEGWTLNASASVVDGALQLDNPGAWAEAAMAEFAVEVGTEYTLSWKSQRVSGTGAFLMFILKGDNANHTITGTNWMNSTSTEWVESSITFVAEEANLKLKISPEVADAGVILIDDIVLTEKVYGQVVNGDFSNGSEGWNLSGYASVVDGAIQLDNPTQYNETLSQVVEIEPNTTYEITWKSKRVSGTGAFNLYVIQSVSPWANLTRVDGQNWMNETSGEWVANSYTVNSGDNTNMLLKFSTEGTNPGVILLDDVVVTKVIEPEQPDESIVWSVDFNDGEKKFNVGEVVAEGPDGSNCYKWDFAGGWGSNYASGLSLDATKDYTVTMKVKGSINSTMAITLMPGSWATWWNGPSFSVTTEWQEVILHIPAGSTSFNTGIFEFQGTGNEPAYTLYVDDIVISEGLAELPEPDNYLVNGDLETGDTAPWNNLWNSCPTVEIVEGMDGGYGLHIVSGKWNHVRQTNIAVKANTWYKVTLWAKNTNNMCVLVKNGADNDDIINKPVTAGDEWTEFTIEFNTGDYTSIIFSLMGGEGEEQQEGTFDNILMEKAPCQHEYEITGGSFPTCDTDGATIYTCSGCGDSYEVPIPAYHNGNLEYTAAKDPVDCATPGNIEYYYCPGCNEYFADANAGEMINPWYIEVTVDCVKPEGLADCADWTCEVCGNENYGSGEHDTGVPACQDGHCSKCDKDIAGYGHQNYDGPACLPGNCYYCGEAMEPVAHENGAWAPCLEGECSYGCGLTYPATAEHVDDDANGYCDTCWSVMPHDCIDEDGNYECDICYSTMPHDCIDEDGDLHCDICWGVMPHDCIDEDGDGWCDICWEMMPEEPEVVYGDADGDGEITLLDASLLSQYVGGYDVTLDEIAADADGDGEITLLDASLLSQYVGGYDVNLGPQG